MTIYISTGGFKTSKADEVAINFLKNGIILLNCQAPVIIQTY